jgi:hypothetical protein
MSFVKKDRRSGQEGSYYRGAFGRILKLSASSRMESDSGVEEKSSRKPVFVPMESVGRFVKECGKHLKPRGAENPGSPKARRVLRLKEMLSGERGGGKGAGIQSREQRLPEEERALVKTHVAIVRAGEMDWVREIQGMDSGIDKAWKAGEEIRTKGVSRCFRSISEMPQINQRTNKLPEESDGGNNHLFGKIWEKNKSSGWRVMNERQDKGAARSPVRMWRREIEEYPREGEISAEMVVDEFVARRTEKRGRDIRKDAYYIDSGMFQGQQRRESRLLKRLYEEGECGALKIPGLHGALKMLFGVKRDEQRSATRMRRIHVVLKQMGYNREKAQIFSAIARGCIWQKRRLIELVEQSMFALQKIAGVVGGDERYLRECFEAISVSVANRDEHM